MVATALPWTDRDEVELAELLEDQQNGETLDAYIRRVSPAHLPPRHIKPIVDLWERTRHERVLACIELPPRHAKTTTGMHALAWRLHRDPTLTNGFATFGDDFAASRSRICRALTKSGGVALDKSMANLHEWRTVYGGGSIFRGYMGEWTGKGIDGVGLIDDPYKDRAAAESKKIRNNIREWFADVFWTRLEPAAGTGAKPGSCIVQHTRWHEDDLIGWLLAGKFSGYKFERIRLPAICEDEDDLIGRNIGEALWPERFPVDELRRIEASIGPYSWASLFQQRPRPKGADVFCEPQRFLLRDFNWQGKRILLCCDPAATDDTRNDFSAAFVLAAEGYGDDMKVWAVFGWRDHLTIPDLVTKLIELQERYWKAPVAVEAVGAFKSVPQMMRKIDNRLRVREVRPVGDKFTRAQPLAAAVAAGRFFVPLDAEVIRRKAMNATEYERKTTWADELIGEMSVFTGVDDAEDDQIDACAHGFNELRGAKIIKRGATRNSRSVRVRSRLRGIRARGGGQLDDVTVVATGYPDWKWIARGVRDAVLPHRRKW